MVSINIFKLLSTFLLIEESAPLTKLSNIDVNFCESQELNPGPIGKKQECHEGPLPQRLRMKALSTHVARSQVIVDVLAQVGPGLDLGGADGANVAHPEGSGLVVAEGQVDKVVKVIVPGIPCNGVPEGIEQIT